MRTVVAPLPHDEAVLAALATLGRPVGFVDAPPGALSAVVAGTGPDYVVLYPLDGSRWGPISDEYADAALSYQVTCVARSPHGARWLVAAVEQAMRAIVSVPGRSVLHVTPDDLGGVEPDRDTNPPVFLATPRYTLNTTPA